MLFYSEKNKKFYKTEDELKVAEKEYDKEQAAIEKKAAEKKDRAEAIKKAYEHAQEVRKAAGEMIKAADQEYYDLRNEFVKDYGSFHMSYSDKNATVDDAITELSKALLYWPW